VITRFEVVAVITNAVAVEGIDELPEGTMKPRVVADHGSANVAAYTRKNIEVQGLDLWLSGIGRPTGNARTERVIGTLKREEIKLQEKYESEQEARSRISAAIWDYNFRRPIVWLVEPLLSAYLVKPCYLIPLYFLIPLCS
jgi:transposase InsO family protein